MCMRVSMDRRTRWLPLRGVCVSVLCVYVYVVHARACMHARVCACARVSMYAAACTCPCRPVRVRARAWSTWRRSAWRSTVTTRSPPASTRVIVICGRGSATRLPRQPAALPPPQPPRRPAATTDRTA